MARDYKREYWRPRALALIREINFPLFYGIPSDEVERLGDEVGWDILTRDLRYKQLIEDEYWGGNQGRATRLWRQRPDDADYPDWFWQYHVFDA